MSASPFNDSRTIPARLIVRRIGKKRARAGWRNDGLTDARLAPKLAMRACICSPPPRIRKK